MALEVETRDELSTEFLSAYGVAFPEKNKSRGSDPWRLARVVSGLCWTILARLLSFDKQRLPDTAEGANLARWGGIFKVEQLAAAVSSGSAALRCTGTVGAPVTTGAQLTHADGTIYAVASVGAVIGGGGTVDVDVTSISKGLATNKLTGETLTFTSPPLNVNATATLVKDLTKGLDLELESGWRERILARIGDPPTGGSVADYIDWARSIPGVAKAYLWRHRRGLGTIDLAVLGAGTGAARIVTDTSPVDELIETERPANLRDFVVLGTTAQSQDVTVRIEQDSSKYKWDWDDGGLSTYLITAIDAGLKTITVPGAPAAIIAGKRLTVRGEESTVVSRAGDVLTLSVWFTFTPTLSTDFIRASGDQVVATRSAIIALFDRLGPARDTRYAATVWPSSLLTDDILAAAKSVIGDGQKAIVDLPVADVTPADALNGALTVPFLVPGKVQVWKKV